MPSGECTSTTDWLAGGHTGCLFLTFSGPVCADRISNCPLDRVLTYKNLIYLLNLQIGIHLIYTKYIYIIFIFIGLPAFMLRGI